MHTHCQHYLSFLIESFILHKVSFSIFRLHFSLTNLNQDISKSKLEITKILLDQIWQKEDTFT